MSTISSESEIQRRVRVTAYLTWIQDQEHPPRMTCSSRSTDSQEHQQREENNQLLAELSLGMGSVWFYHSF